MKKIKVLSLFDGISVAQQALKELGYDVEYYASEIDKYAIQITQKNHPKTIQVGDVRNIRYCEHKNCLEPITDIYRIKTKIDLLIGGSPCQDLSIAKKNRQGLDGARSGLFWEYVRILKEVKPKYFVLENVNSMPKEAKAIITEALGVEPIMINASLVSAQNRKRLFWTNIPNVTLPKDRGILLKDILEKDVDEKYNVQGVALRNRGDGKKPEFNNQEKANAMTTVQTDSMIRIGQIGKGGQGDRIYSPDGKSVGLSALGGGRGAKTGLYAVALTKARTELGKQKRAEMRKKTGKDWGSWKEEDMEYVPRNDEKMNTITTGMTKEGLILQDTIIRKLTPIECERLQSLPDNYTEGVSNTQRYKALGNAFNKEVVKHILKNMK